MRRLLRALQWLEQQAKADKPFFLWYNATAMQVSFSGPLSVEYGSRRLGRHPKAAQGRSPSVLYGDLVWPKILAACARKQRKGASGDERQRAVGRIDRKHLDLIGDIVQRI
jgi:hypothetical protein